MQRLKAHAANQGSMFLEAPFDYFGLDDQWQGLRWIGGSGTSDGQVHHLLLGHGDDPFDPDVPVVRVDTRVAPPVLGDLESDFAMERFNFTRQQIGDFWRATGVLQPEIRAAAFTPGQVAQDPTGPWESETIPIDGTDTTVAVLRHGDVWVGQAQRADRLIGVDAHGWPARRTGLVTVGARTLDEYTRGSDELWSRRRPERG